MIHFQHPKLLYLLIIVVLLIALRIVMRLAKQRRLNRFADRAMFSRLMPDASRWRGAVKYGLLMLALALLIVAAANPQMGSKRVKGERIGSDVAICLDISNSMMAEDIQPNRLERAKRMVSRLLEHMAGDRVSLIVFAGSSYIQMPLTNDYSATRLFLEQIDCSMISAQGTAIGDAIEKAMQSLGYGEETWQSNKGRAIVIISDGENHEDDAEEAAREAAKEGVVICAIGMGLPDGAPIPQYNRHGQRTGLKQDAEGNTVLTYLNEQMLQDIAHAGKGIYLRGGNINANMDDLYEALDDLEKEHYDEAQFEQYESQYQYPVALALLCLLADLLLFERRNRRWRISFVVLLMLLPMTGLAQDSPTRKAMRQGNRQYKKEQHDKAELNYRKALDRDSTYWTGHYNLGNALYRQKHYTQAAEHYGQALQRKDLDTAQRQRILHNRGNSYLKAGLADRENGGQYFQQAVNDYREALKLDPKNNDTRYNLSYAQRLLQQSQQNQQNQQNNQDQNQQQNQQNQNQQNQNQQGQDKNQQQNQQNQQNQQDKQDQQQQGQNQQQQGQDKKDQQGEQQKQQGQQKQDQQRNQQGESPETRQKKQDAERLLRAVEQNEKQSLKEHRNGVEVGRVKRTDKDW